MELPYYDSMVQWKDGTFGQYMACEWCDYWEYVQTDPTGDIIRNHEQICEKAPPFPFNQLGLRKNPSDSYLEEVDWIYHHLRTWDEIPITLKRDSWSISDLDGRVLAWLKYENIPAKFFTSSDGNVSPWNPYVEYTKENGINRKEWLKGKETKTGFIEYQKDYEIVELINNLNIEEAIELAIEWIKEVDPENRNKKQNKKLLDIAKKHEKLLEFDEAAEMYKNLGMNDEAIRIRKLKAEQGAVKVDQTVVQGDQISKTEIKDSVLNRSNVGGGSSKMQELKDLTEMKKEGLIDDDEFKQMKKEILGK